MSAERIPTAIDRIAEDWVDTYVALSPTTATYIGRNEHNGRYEDLSPEGAERVNEATRSARDALSAAAPVDFIDEVTKNDLLAELNLSLEKYEAKDHLRDLNVIDSPVQHVREAFDLMPTETVADWEVVSERLGNVSRALQGYRDTLRAGISAGVVPARRQVVEVLGQVERIHRDNGFFVEFAGDAAPAEGNLPASLAREVVEQANAARIAYRELGEFLTHELLPVAGEQDAVGREFYQRNSRRFLGASIDLDETYEWGRDELARMVAEQESIANEIQPGATVEEAVAFLEASGTHRLNGKAELQEWMQRTSDEAIVELSKTHFEIAPEIRALECMIAPTNEGGIYYTGPTDDFSRPGRMWWSVPEGVTTFDTWREKTTVYHEGVPGHHLQIAQATLNRAELNSWRRLLAGTSGHAEGWALYAERLMQELGYLDDPADRLGMLDGQRMRAARVVLDIGVHLQKPRLDGSGVWDADYALDFFGKNVNMSQEFVKFEVNRYLGWPGQAPSYKVGQRIWEQVRDEYRAAKGEAYSAKEFHKRALDMGGVGLDTLRTALTAR